MLSLEELLTFIVDYRTRWDGFIKAFVLRWKSSRKLGFCARFLCRLQTFWGDHQWLWTWRKRVYPWNMEAVFLPCLEELLTLWNTQSVRWICQMSEVVLRWKSTNKEGFCARFLCSQWQVYVKLFEGTIDDFWPAEENVVRPSTVSCKKFPQDTPNGGVSPQLKSCWKWCELYTNSFPVNVWRYFEMDTDKF